jgi:hypothetical protein
MLLLKSVKVSDVSRIACLEILRGLVKVRPILKLKAFHKGGVLDFNRLHVVLILCLEVLDKLIVS